MTIDRPQASEFNQFYDGYIGKVSAGGPLAMLNHQVTAFEKLRSIPEGDAGYRYAEGKWSVKELVGHMADTERLFAYRLLHIVRGDQAPLAGMDEKAWSAMAPHGRRHMKDVVAEMIVVRLSTVALVGSIEAEAMGRTGVANNFPISARALCWILPGHAQHHLDVLRERYRITAV